MKPQSLSRKYLALAAVGVSLAALSLLVVAPPQPAGASDGLALSMSAPRTAREADLIEYTLELVNEGPTEIANITVSESLPAEVTFVDAVSSAGGIYDPVAQVWSLPRLGTSDSDRSAILQLQALVRTDVLTDPQIVVAAVNRASVIQPEPTNPTAVEVTTSIVCGFCIDWTIESVDVGSDYRIEDKGGGFGDFESRYFFYVRVVNSGPIASEATLTAIDFSAPGGVFSGEVFIVPPLSVPVALDVDETQTVTFSTNWQEGPYSSGTIYAAFEITDVSLLDPVLPNTAEGSYYIDVDDHVDGGGGCFIATAAFGSDLDPHVESLRRFRDQILMRSEAGRRLVAGYYELSPPIAAYIEDKEGLKWLIRLMLIPMIFVVDHPALVLNLVCGVLILVLIRRQLRKTASGT